MGAGKEAGASGGSGPSADAVMGMIGDAFGLAGGLVGAAAGGGTAPADNVASPPPAVPRAPAPTPFPAWAIPAAGILGLFGILMIAKGSK